LIDEQGEEIDSYVSLLEAVEANNNDLEEEYGNAIT